MMSNQIFAPTRFFKLFREEVFSGYRITLIVASVVFAFLMLIFTIVASDHSDADFHQVWYPIVLLAGGFYFTSTSFNVLNRKEQRMNYLSIPASIFEKFSLKLLITTLGYTVMATLLYWLFSESVNAITQRYFSFSFWEFNPFSEFNLFFIKLYIVIQSVFILGAATFNRFSFFKTLFALGLIYIALSLFGWLLFRIIFADLFDGLLVPRDNITVFPSYRFQDFVEFTAWPLLQNIFWYVMAPIFWVVAYFKLKEREV